MLTGPDYLTGSDQLKGLGKWYLSLLTNRQLKSLRIFG
jgi:hypothetical protein